MKKNTAGKRLGLFAIMVLALALFVVPGLACASAVDNPEDGDIANSYRFVDGQPVSELGEDTAEEHSEGAVAEGTASDLIAAASTYSWYYKVGSRTINCNSSGVSGILAKGIDVSKWNGNIDWDTVATTDVDFVIIRCGYGTDSTSHDDQKWLRNVTACERLGIPYGVYLYSYATSTSAAQSEANHALRLLSGHHPQLPVYYDLEDSSISSKCSKAQIATNASVFCNAMENAGYTPGIYANVYWRKTYLTSSVFNNWSFWVAQYNTRCTYTGSYDLWQSGFCYVNGISGELDNNFMFVDIISHESEPSYASFVNDLPGEACKIALRANQSYVVDAAGSSADGANAQLSSDQGSSATHQYWYFQLQDDGTYKIVNAATGLCLSVSGTEKDGSNVQQVASSDATEQRWHAERLTTGVYTFQNEATGAYLDVVNAIAADGTNVQVWSAGNSVAQSFVLKAQSSYANDGSIVPTADDDPVPVYRLYNQWTGEHLFTMSESERDALSAIGWTQEGVAWQVVATDDQPVYRMYNPWSGDHLYTQSFWEYDGLAAQGWQREGVAWYVSSEGGTTVYRLYNQWLTAGTHLYTTDQAEYDLLVSLGWSGEGIAFNAA